jgi:peptidyl-lysine (3S)-dioxygenase / protease
LWIGDERSVSSIHKDHFENMYAVITGEKTFTLLPPTDLLYLEEKEYPSMQYRVKGNVGSAPSSTAGCIDGTPPHPTTLVNRVKAGDLELTRNGCPTESLTWIGTDPDDPNVLMRHPTFRHARPLRCKIQPGEILYIPGAYDQTDVSV